jgi:enoyl-[acyl-carrier protein] reductase/trans-2-enoyl-CoA reductase (NAD+)
VSEISIEPSSGDDIENTVAVMGGEDWKMWMDALKAENLLAPGATTVAYSYIGPSLTEAVYRKGTIGRAKDDLEATAFTITDSLALTESLCFCKQSLSDTSKFSDTSYSFVYFFIV